MENKRRVKFGIRMKLMATFFFVILLAIVILASMLYFKASNSYEENLLEQSNQILHDAKTYIETYLNGFGEKIDMLATEDILLNINVGTANHKKAMDLFGRLNDSSGDIVYSYIGTAGGDMLMMPEDELPEGYDPRVRPWYTDAINAGGKVWTEPYTDATSGSWIISVARPVLKNGKVQGVIALDISLTDISEKLGNIKIGKKGYPVLTTDSGITMSHKSTDLIGEEIPVPELLKAVQEGRTNNLEYKFNGATKFATFEHLDTVNWTLLSALDRSEIAEDANAILVYSVIVGLIGLVVALIISYIFARQITNNIKVLLTGFAKIKEGDFTARIKSTTRDEIGLLEHYLNDTVEELGDMIRKIQGIANGVTESAQNLAATSEEASASADEVARTVEDIARGASDQAKDAESGAVVAKSLSEKFTTLMEKTHAMISSAKEVMDANIDGVKAIDGLKEKTVLNEQANEEIEKVITELDNKTQSIEAILDSISAVAVQTNLLALNASIEAARAGEHGKGFAVVAEEIRKLAEESSAAADEVRDIVTNIQNDSTRTVKSMKSVKEISQEQSVAVGEVNTSFETISSSIDLIAKEIEIISDSVEDLNTDKESIVTAIENISAVSEETAAASEEVSASMDQQTIAVEDVARAAETLNEISVELNQETAKFKV